MPLSLSAGKGKQSAVEKIRLAVRIWFWHLVIRVGLRRYSLPGLVTRLGRTRKSRSYGLDHRRMGRAVQKALRIGPLEARCLVTALVLYRLVREEEEPAQLVIGLPHEPTSKDAHAWVEIDGIDVGPPPGGAGHRVLARFG
jgi:transglutaminase superfamily protein